jgi:hypothetical protein
MPPGAAVRVAPHVTVPVRVRIALRVRPGADPLAVLRRVRVRLGADPPDADTPEPGLLHPERVELGRAVDASDVYGALTGVPDLTSAFVEAFHRDGRPAVRADRVAVPADAVAAWTPAGSGPHGALDGRTGGGTDGVALAWAEADR